MIKVEGLFNEAIVYTDEVEAECLRQIKELCDTEVFENSKIRIMPDTHGGKGCVIGTTMTITDKIVPNLVGVDIGCGVEAVILNEKEIDVEKLDKVIREHVPSGFNTHNDYFAYDCAKDFLIPLEDLKCVEHVNLDRAKKSMGTLGGGNHFIEVNKATNGDLYLVVHSGSRNLGKQVAEYYQKLAYDKLTEKGVKIKKDLAYLEGSDMRDYLFDMGVVQTYASLNRMMMLSAIGNEMGLGMYQGAVGSVHNYIDLNRQILRKGSISASDGEMVIIPINMRDGSIIAKGKGNKDWNYSAPHGAGRVMARGRAKRELNYDEYVKSMEGIYSTSISKDTLDEAPMVYKPMEDIVKYTEDTIEIIDIIKPIYNFKAN